MVYMIYILFISIVAPMLLMLFLLEKQARYTVGFMIIGIMMCLFASEINTLVMNSLGTSVFYTTVTLSPMTEEIIKAIPILFFAFFISDDRQRLLSISMAVGIGFAILENTYIIVQYANDVNIFFALVRGFASGLMHGICTAAVGYGISYVRKKKKLFYTGTFGLLTAACIYHATYNALVQSQYQYVGFLFPILTYIPVVIVVTKKKRK